MTEWDETNSGTDGVRTYNRGIHVMHLSWGRATRLLICPDTIGLRATLDRLAATGKLWPRQSWIEFHRHLGPLLLSGL